jgi:hypothetical protein
MTTGQNGKAGDVTLTDLTIGTSFAKASNGTLSITGVRAAFGTIANAAGAINLTGNAPATSVNIASLTQNGKGKITLNALNALTALTINESNDLDYENAFITTVTVAAGKTVNGYGTKCSGIKNQVAGAGKFIPTTDVWDGSSKSFQTTDEIYTSGSFAKLADAAGAVNQWVEIDLGGKKFNGIATGVTSYTGKHWQGAPVNNFVAGGTVKNLTAANGMFKNLTAVLTVNDLTLDNAVITADKEAGCFIGKTTKDVTFNSVNVTNATVGGTKFEGASIGVGGFIGVVDGAANVNIYKCKVSTATLKGHYYVGGFIGQVVNGGTIKLMGAGGSKSDEVGTQASGLTFDIQSKDGVWSTLKNGTVAPFIGGIKKLTNLNIYGEYDSFDRTASKWNLNFLENEAIKFYGTKRDDLNFIGYTSVATGDGITGTYNLKLRSGFEANPNMKLANTANSLDKSKVLDIEYNAYLIDSQW